MSIGKMRVVTKMMGRFRSGARGDRRDAIIELSPGSTVADALRALGVADDEPWNASIDGQLVEAERVLRQDDVLFIFTPIDGG